MKSVLLDEFHVVSYTAEGRLCNIYWHEEEEWMNNGKVRIYELSKELNLDNRDILAVCDQLNINVKSHSSTISDAEAARIRSAAEKYTPSQAAPAKPHSSGHTPSSPARPSAPQPPVKKQQILEIRRNRTAAEPPKRPNPGSPTPPRQSAPTQGADDVSDALPPAELLTALEPVPPVEHPEPVAEESPAPVSEAAISEAATGEDSFGEIATSDEPATPELAIAPEEVSEPVVEPESPVAVAEVQAGSAPVASTPMREQPPKERAPKPLVGPPRPVAAKPPVVQQSAPPSAPMPSSSTTTAPSGSVSRPILKRVRDEQSNGRSAPPETGRSPQPVKPTTAPQPNRNRPSKDAPQPGLVSPPKRPIELRSKPIRPDAAPASTDPDATPIPGPVKRVGLDSPGEAGAVDLKRPTPPRPPKRGKGWEEEEEQEETPKAKVGVKGKRRTVVDDEDIDLDEVFDLDDDASGEDSPVQVSLSLARPPKPKSSKAPQAKPAAVAQKTRRPSTPTDRTTRRDRRDQEAKERPTQVTLTGSLSVHDLAELLTVPETDIIKALFFKGIAANINQILDIPTATMVAQEFEVEALTGQAEAEAKKVTEMLDAEDLENLERRPPVVTIMGHVDHGKTTLLDSIRKTKVAQGEAGGITQHIGAYHVDVSHDGRMEQVVFLDTPGHEAFTAMRARGARVTDIAVLVVAADDGVRPQTIEAISHAKAAEVPIVVAINKVDKEDSQPDRVKQELTEFALVPEEWGGDTIMVPVSALTGENLDTLLEMLLLVSEVEDLYANPDRPAKGTVIEANLDKARGPVATLLIQNGTLRVGDVLVVGSSFGKVRAMVDDRGRRVTEARPSFAVEVLGLNDVPAAGDEFEVYVDEKEARSVAGGRADQQRLSRLQQAMASRRVSLNTISAQAQEGELKELNLILKADVQGSVEAILGSLQQLPQKEVQVRVLLAAPGEITETDVDLAAASNAVIIGFNTTFASGARQAADNAGVDVRDYNIIYKLLEDVQGAMEGLLEPEMVEEPLGQVEVRAIFPVGKGTVAGCYILSGKAIRNCKIRVRRGNDVVYEGSLDSLKRMKDDVKEVNAGFECGVRIDNFNNWAEGDIIETFRLATKRRSLTA